MGKSLAILHCDVVFVVSVFGFISKVVLGN